MRKHKDRKYTFDGQHDDESVLMLFRHHPVVMRKGLLALLLFLTIGMLPAAIWPKDLGNLLYAPLGLMVGMVVFFYSWIGWHFSVILVTDQRMIHIKQKGLFNRSVVDVGLDKIQNINYQVAGLQQTLFGFGTILVQTFVGDLVLHKIHHPEKMQEEIISTIKDLGYDTNLKITQTEHEEDKGID